MAKHYQQHSVNEGLTKYERALLDTIAGTESPNYNTMYGGSEFSDYSQHPGIAHTILSGPNAGKKTSAAGRYQFLGSTWNQIAKDLGLTDFSPENQDAAAFALASQVYAQAEGRDLATDLASGDPKTLANISSVLHGTWTSLPGGIETNTNVQNFLNRFNNNVDFYDASTLASAPEAAAHLPGSMAADQVDRLAEREAQLTPEKAPSTFDSLKSILGAPVTGAITGWNALSGALSGLSPLAQSLAPTAQAATPPTPMGPPHTPTPDSAYSSNAPVSPVEYGGSLSPPPGDYSASGGYSPNSLSAPSGMNPTGYYSGLGSYAPNSFGAASSGPQSTASSYSLSDLTTAPSYTPSYSQLAPGAATATQMFGTSTLPSYTTQKTLNPAYTKAIQAQEQAATFDPLAAPDVGMNAALSAPVGVASWDDAAGMMGPPASAKVAKPVAPAAPKTLPPKYITQKVPVAPKAPVSMGPTNYTGNGAAGLTAALNDMNASVANSAKAFGYDPNEAAAPQSQATTLGSILANMLNPGNAGGNYSSDSKAYGHTDYGVGSYGGGQHSTLGGGDSHRAL